MLKINDVTVLKFSVNGKTVEKTGKVYSISGEDKRKMIRFVENEEFKFESWLDENGRILQENCVEKGVESVTKYEYTADGKIYEKRFNSDGNVTSERVTNIEENGRKITKDNDGNETVIEILEENGKKIRRIIRSKNGEVVEVVERHYENDRPVYSCTKLNGEILESFCKFDETGYCVHQRDSNGTEYRNVKSDDGRFVIMYEKSGSEETILGITERIKEDEMSCEIHYHLV